MSKITYEFYNEKDASAVAELMKKNQFWIGKFDENLTGEKFIDYQRKKGTIFGIIGKKKEKVVSYVAAYSTGGQKVANKNQVFICALIIDQKYRLSVFSITDMFSLLVKELIKRGYNDLICEVPKDNYPSFYMMRKCGFVIIDEEPTLYGDYILHNYFPGIIKVTNKPSYANSDSLVQTMQKINKNDLYKAEPLLYERFIMKDYMEKKSKSTLLIDTISGNIAGIEIHGKRFKLWPKEGDFREYIFENTSMDKMHIKVEKRFLNGGVDISEYDTDAMSFVLEDQIETITFSVNEADETLTFYINEMLQQGLYKFQQNVIDLKGYYFEEKSAFLSCASDDNGLSLFKEMWPHVCAPYIEGITIPNYEKNISVEVVSEKKIIAIETTEDYVLTREYKSFGKKIEISTKVKMLTQKLVQPMFQFALYDLSYNMDILLDHKTVANRKYDPEDGHCVTEEMIFLDFLKHEYSSKYFKQIDLSFDSLPKTIFRIKTDKLAKCFCQLNYLGIEYNIKIYKGKKEIDFGIVSIERIET